MCLEYSRVVYIATLNKKNIPQKFGRLVDVNLVIRAFATDPKYSSYLGKHELTREIAMVEIPRTLEQRTQGSLGYKEQNTETWSNGISIPC